MLTSKVWIVDQGLSGRKTICLQGGLSEHLSFKQKVTDAHKYQTAFPAAC
jgi:hypothetical protein